MILKNMSKSILYKQQNHFELWIFVPIQNGTPLTLSAIVIRTKISFSGRNAKSTSNLSFESKNIGWICGPHLEDNFNLNSRRCNIIGL